ncbi:hypothetical protein MKX03_027736, partial [Papaver bracteatum]
MSYCASGMPLGILGLGAGIHSVFLLIAANKVVLYRLVQCLTVVFGSEGGGCGVGIGLGWEFGTAFGSHYRTTKTTFEGTDFN